MVYRAVAIDARHSKPPYRRLWYDHLLSGYVMKTIEICDKIDSSDYEQFEEDGTDIEEVCEMLATAYRRLHEAAREVVAMECSRVNADGGEPYDPIVNPGQFDFRITNLAKILES